MTSEQPVKFLNSDVSLSDIARALHRVVRAMHDGECPKCHELHSSDRMRDIDKHDRWVCPSCGFSISNEEADAALECFKPYMENNLKIFENWRKLRNG